MSEYKRLREFVEGEDAKADDVETEFDNVYSVLHKGITQDNLAPGYKPQALAWGPTASNLPYGSGPIAVMGEETFSVDAPSNALITWNVQGHIQASQAINSWLVLDGVKKDERFISLEDNVASELSGSMGFSYVYALAAGSHSFEVFSHLGSGVIAPAVVEFVTVTILLVPA